MIETFGRGVLRSFCAALVLLASLAAPAAAWNWPLTTNWYAADFRIASPLRYGTGVVLFKFKEAATLGCPNGRIYQLTTQNDDGWVETDAEIKLCNPQDQPGGFTRFTWIKLANGNTCTFDLWPDRAHWSGCTVSLADQWGRFLGGVEDRQRNAPNATPPGLQCIQVDPDCTWGANGLQLARCVRDCAQKRFLGTGSPGSTASTNCRTHVYNPSLPGVFNPADCVARLADVDGDRIPDQIEQDLADRYAPILHLHPQDPNPPANADWYLARTDLEYFWDKDVNGLPCRGSELVDANPRNDSVLTSRTHSVLDLAACRSTSSLVSSSQVQPSSQGFVLTGCKGTPCESSTWNPAEWKLYANVYPISISDTSGLLCPGVDNRGIAVQYFVFYPYNDTNSADALGITYDHESDWEWMSVFLSATDPALGAGNWSSGPDFSVQQGKRLALHRHEELYSFTLYGSWSGTHPKILVSQGSHAMYYDKSSCDQGGAWGTDNCVSFEDARRWYPWAGGSPGGSNDYQGAGVALISSDRERLMNGFHWLGFSGNWGKEPKTGPRGPAWKTWGSSGGECYPATGSSVHESYRLNYTPALPVW